MNKWILICSIVISSIVLYSENAVSATLANQYDNHDYGFSMKYPSNFVLHEGNDGVVFDDLTFRLFQGSTIESFIYSGSQYTGTNLVGAGIAIGKIIPSKELGCKTVGLGEKTSGNLKFYHGVSATTLGSISSHSNYYEVAGDQGCFMIEMSLKADKSSTAKPLTDEDKNALKMLMDESALTFILAQQAKNKRGTQR